MKNIANLLAITSTLADSKWLRRASNVNGRISLNPW